MSFMDIPVFLRMGFTLLLKVSAQATFDLSWYLAAYPFLVVRFSSLQGITGLASS